MGKPRYSCATSARATAPVFLTVNDTAEAVAVSAEYAKVV